jgi:hypothetical protein
MTFGTAQDLSSQVVSIPMNSFGMLMNSPDSEFQRIGPQKRAWQRRYRLVDWAHNSMTLADFPVLLWLYSGSMSALAAINVQFALSGSGIHDRGTPGISYA